MRIYHKFVNSSVPRVTVWHQEVCQGLPAWTALSAAAACLLLVKGLVSDLAQSFTGNCRHLRIEIIKTEYTFWLNQGCHMPGNSNEVLSGKC